MKMTSQSFWARLAIFIVETICQKRWGFKPTLMPHFVEQLGSVGAVVWVARHMPKYEKIARKWGPLRTNMMASVISVLNRCHYCSTGHTLAFQLHYLKIHGSLFPLDEADIFNLGNGSDDYVLETLIDYLKGANLASEVPYLERLFTLRATPSLVEGSDDSAILLLLAMFAKLNECALRSEPELDGVHDPINLDTELIKRYENLRHYGQKP